MNGEITFRRAVVGGFNREDVMNYISTVATSNSEQQKLRVNLRETQATVEKLQAELDAKNNEIVQSEQDDGEKEELRAALSESQAVVESLQAELDAKNQEIESLKAASAEVDELKAKLQQYESKTTEFDETAEKLMRESMAYADRYVESANLMAGNVRKETLVKVKDANSKVDIMLEKAAAFCKETEEFEEILNFFKTQLKDIEKTFE